jgi:F-type H+-transporting ATPase subunit b
MVTINFTLLVETGLFLVFMWAMHRWVFKPLLAVMDARADQMAEDKKVSVQAVEEAERLEADMALRLSEIHHAASQRVVRMHYKFQQRHHEEVEAFKRQAQQELDAVREESRVVIEEQRKHYDAPAQDLAGAISTQLGLEHTA